MSHHHLSLYRKLTMSGFHLQRESHCFSSKLAKHEIKTMSHHSKHHFITHHISLRGTAVNEFYQMIRMGVADHVRGNRTKTK